MAQAISNKVQPKPIVWGVPQGRSPGIGMGTQTSTSATAIPANPNFARNTPAPATTMPNNSFVQRPATAPQQQTSSYSAPKGGGSTGSGTAQMAPVAPKTGTAKGIISTPTRTPKSQNQTSFGSLVGGIADASKASSQQKGLVKDMQKRAGAYDPIAAEAKRLSEMYGGEIARVGKLGAGAVAGNLSTGTNVVGSGNAAIASQSASDRMSALSQGLNAELLGTGQQMSANQNAASTLNSALTGATSLQQQQLSGLGAAAGLSAPNPAAYGQTVFNPLQGGYSGGGNMDPQTQAGTLAQQVMSGQMTLEQAQQAMGYAGQAGNTFLTNAITQAGGNPLQLQASGAAQQSNIGTQGTAMTDIARQGLGDATQQYVQMNSAAQYAGQQSAAVSNILARSGLNNSSSSDYNKAINELGRRFSDTDRAALDTALVEARNSYSQLLSIGGGTPTGNEASALSTLDSNKSAAAINASIQQLEAAVARRLQAQQSAVQQFQGNLGGSYAGGGGGYSGGGGGQRFDSWDSLLD